MTLNRNQKKRIRDDRPRRGFDIITWLVPTLGFLMFTYAMAFIAIYTIRVGGPNVGLYVPAETPKPTQETDVGQVLKGISDAFDPNKK